MLHGRRTSLVVGLLAALSAAGGIAQASAASKQGGGTRCRAVSCASVAAAHTASPLLVRSTSATLAGFVGAHGARTSAYFQYGAGATPARRTRVIHVSATQARALVRVRILDLAPATQYRFRIVVHNHHG